jgi:2-desacetyl-2-hydroxyethyl bacteriochlorophyllide A dehydrogenase
LRALYTAAPGDFVLADRPIPNPGHDWALIRVVRAGICHTDVIIRSGKAGHVRYPFIPGHEFSAVVEEIGAGVQQLVPGDRVAVEILLNCGVCSYCHKGLTNKCENLLELGATADGGFAEHCVVPVSHLIRLPDSISDAAAAMAEPLANAVAVVTQSDISPGDRVVVIGAGAIGYLVLQVARLYSPTVLVLADTSDGRLALGASLGATHTVNVKTEDGCRYLREILGPRGADIIYECAGTRSALEIAMEHIGMFGRIVLEGVHDTDALIPISPYKLLTCRSARLIGMDGWSCGDFMRAVELLNRKAVDADRLVTHTFPLASWEAAFEMATTRKDESIKVQFDLTGQALH